jgi:calcineurin-like phosphoesterase family protein
VTRRVLVLLALVMVGAATWASGWMRDDGAVRLPHGPWIGSTSTARAVVWAVGDGADGSSAAKALARRIAAAGPNRFLYLGDVYDRGTAAEFLTNYRAVYGRLARITAPTPGNHDWPNHVKGYDPYWRRVTGKAPPAFYAFTVAGWRMLSLNSEIAHGGGSVQLRWLRRQLRAPGTCRIAFWHRPRYSAGRHGDQEDMAPVWQALRGHARIVVTGHDHDMQRFKPRDGIIGFVSGAGGRSHYGIDRGHRGLAFANDRDWGALRLELQPGRARFAFVTSTGRTLDSGSTRCQSR